MVQLIENHLRFPGQYFDAESGLNYNYFRDYDPKTGRYIEPDPIGLRGGMSLYGYPNNPLRFVDPYGLTWKTNLEFFWDWVFEQGKSKRAYGEGTVELQEMKSSPGATKMRSAYKAGNCRSIYSGSFGSGEAYIKTALMPNSTAFQVGGFVYDAINNSDGTVTYTIRNQASAYSFFLHIPGIPHTPRGGTLPLFGNIDQVFQWSESSPCCEERK